MRDALNWKYKALLKHLAQDVERFNPNLRDERPRIWLSTSAKEPLRTEQYPQKRANVDSTLGSHLPISIHAKGPYVVLQRRDDDSDFPRVLLPTYFSQIPLLGRLVYIVDRKSLSLRVQKRIQILQDLFKVGRWQVSVCV